MLEQFQSEPMPVQYRDQVLHVQEVSAAEFVAINDRFAEIAADEEGQTRAMLEFWAELLAMVVVDPQADKQQWMQIPLTVLTDLGECVTAAIGLGVRVKKNASDPGDDLP